MAHNKNYFYISPSSFYCNPFEILSLALEVEGQIFWVQREVLAMYSPVFKAMLYGEFLEGNKEVVPLPGRKAKDVEEVLCCLIPMPVCKKIDQSNVELALAFSDEYQVADLREKAEDFSALLLERCPKGGKDLLYLLPITSKWNLKILPQCLKRCVDELDLAVLLPVFKDVPDQVKAYLALGGSACRVRHLPGRNLGMCATHSDRCHAKCVVCVKAMCPDCLGGSGVHACSWKSVIDEVKKALLDSM